MDSLYHQQPYPQPFYSPPMAHHHYHPQDHHVFQPYYHQQHAAPPAMWPTMMSPPQTLPPPAALPPVMVPKPKLTTTVWEDQCTLCYQVDVNSVCVTRRQGKNHSVRFGDVLFSQTSDVDTCVLSQTMT